MDSRQTHEHMNKLVGIDVAEQSVWIAWNELGMTWQQFYYKNIDLESWVETNESETWDVVWFSTSVLNPPVPEWNCPNYQIYYLCIYNIFECLQEFVK